MAGKHRLAALIPLAASGPDLKSRLHDVFRDIKGRFRDEPSSSKEMEESIRHCYTVLGCPSHAVAASQAPLGDGGYSSALADFLRSRPSSWLTALGVLVWYGGNRRSAEGGLLQGLLASLAKVHAAGLPNAPWYTEAGGSDAQTRDMFYAVLALCNHCLRGEPVSFLPAYQCSVMVLWYATFFLLVLSGDVFIAYAPLVTTHRAPFRCGKTCTTRLL